MEDFEKLKIPPSNFTVGILVKMYGRRMLDKAFQVAEDMPKRWGVAPNPQVYMCLMSACFLNNNLPRALKVLEDLRGQDADLTCRQCWPQGLQTVDDEDAVSESSSDDRA